VSLEKISTHKKDKTIIYIWLLITYFCWLFLDLFLDSNSGRNVCIWLYHTKGSFRSRNSIRHHTKKGIINLFDERIVYSPDKDSVYSKRDNRNIAKLFTRVVAKITKELWLARISSLSNEVGLYVVLPEVLLFMPNSSNLYLEISLTCGFWKTLKIFWITLN
jgi:hypothetical protein